MSQEIHYFDDNYSKVHTDVLLLIDRVRIVKDKVNKTRWYHIWTHIKLYKELIDLGKETDKIGERLNRLYREKNIIEIIKRR
jgi:hypothetical protein